MLQRFQNWASAKFEGFKTNTINYQPGDAWKAPNIISYIRGVLCWVPGLTFVLTLGNAALWWLPVLVLGAVAATDAIDGFVARRYKLITGLGKFMDPLLDKILIFVSMVFICAAYTATTQWGWWLWILTAVIAAREVIVTKQIRTRGKLVQARLSGKIKMVAQTAMGGALMIPVVGVWTVVQIVLIAFAFVMTIASWVDYWWHFVKKVPLPPDSAETVT